MDPRRERLLALLPDEPRWVDVRGLLLRGGVEVVASRSGKGWIVVAPDVPIAVAVERPGRDAFDHVASARSAPPPVLVGEEDAVRVAAVLAGWRRSGMTLLTLNPTARLPDPGASRLLEPGEAGWPAHAAPPVAASFEAGKAVSACCAHHVTERFWDVSVDTLEGFRRRGHAVSAAAFLIRHMRTLGKEPVWSAEDENVASRRTAERLGLAPSARFALFRPPSERSDGRGPSRGASPRRP